MSSIICRFINIKDNHQSHHLLMGILGHIHHKNNIPFIHSQILLVQKYNDHHVLTEPKINPITSHLSPLIL